MTDQLDALRAEVVALRDEASADAFFYAMEGVYDQMLDLIDKRMEAGR